MDIFQKCYEPSLAERIEGGGAYTPTSTPSSPVMWR